MRSDLRVGIGPIGPRAIYHYPMTDSTLKELFDKYGTDKARNGYHDVYESLLAPRREDITRVLEVGIGTLDPAAPSSMVGYAAEHYTPGGSLRAWADYFPNAVIWGLDTQPDTLLEESAFIMTCLADSTKKDQVDRVLGDLIFDLIIDDGDHSVGSQVATLRNLWDRVATGGLYVIEDIYSQAAMNRIVTVVRMLAGLQAVTFGPNGNLLVITR